MKFNRLETKQPRKKRKALYQAPLHVKQKLAHIHLSKDLRKKMKARSLVAKKGDKVKVVRGEFRGREGKISEVDLRRMRLFVEGLVHKKQGGKEVPAAIHPSNCILVEYQEPKHKMKKKRQKEKAPAATPTRISAQQPQGTLPGEEKEELK